MSPKNRKPKNSSPESSGGNVLFTLGLVSVIALLIVGWVMTQGGLPSLAGKMPNLTNYSLNPSPKPTEATQPIPERSSEFTNEYVNQLVAEYESKLEKLNETWEKRLNQVKSDYERQLVNLKTEILTLTDENQRLNEKLREN